MNFSTITLLFISFFFCSVLSQFAITNCNDLQNINNNLNGTYFLKNNFSCNGYPFVPIGRLFCYKIFQNLSVEFSLHLGVGFQILHQEQHFDFALISVSFLLPLCGHGFGASEVDDPCALGVFTFTLSGGAQHQSNSLELDCSS